MVEGKDILKLPWRGAEKGLGIWRVKEEGGGLLLLVADYLLWTV